MSLIKTGSHPAESIFARLDRLLPTKTIWKLVILLSLGYFALLISMGIGLTLAGNSFSYSYHAYQAELFPTAIRSRAVSFVYSWSRFSAIFTGFMIAEILKWFGVVGVFIFISMAMCIVMLAIGISGPKTKDIALEAISNK